MSKYAKHYSGIVAFGLSALLLASCDSEFYTVEGYDSSIFGGEVLPGESCDASQEGNVICKDDPDTMNGKLYRCQSGQLYLLTDCSRGYSCHDNECGLCNNKSNSSICENGADKIGQLKICKNGEFKEDRSCGTNSCHVDDNSSQTKYECGECNDADFSCKDDPISGEGQIISCANGSVVKTPCPNNKPCKEDGSACSNADCKAGETNCVDDPNTLNGKFTQCLGGMKIVTDCISGFSCNKNKNECGECTNHSVQCKDNKLGVCLDGSYVTYDCKSIANFSTVLIWSVVSCISIDISGVKVDGCTGVIDAEDRVGCFQDNIREKAYKLNWDSITDGSGKVFIKSICPTPKCNADQSGCEGDPTKEEQGSGDEGSGDQGSGDQGSGDQGSGGTE